MDSLRIATLDTHRGICKPPRYRYDAFALVQTWIWHARTLTTKGALVTADTFALGETVFSHFANADVETHVGGARIFLHSTFLFAKLTPVRIATFANGHIGKWVWGTHAPVLTRVGLARVTLGLTRDIHSSVTAADHVPRVIRFSIATSSGAAVRMERKP